MIWLLALFTTVALVVLLVITLTNWVLFPRLAARHGSAETSVSGLTELAERSPPLAILIPARNEAERIGPTIRSLLAQDYPAFTLFLLDDQSTDETVAVARQAALGDDRLHILTGAVLPPGWGGKNWACHQLAQVAGQELLLFTDADVIWKPGALRAVVNELGRHNADLLTVWPTQMTITWGERLVVPLMALAIWAYLPVWLVHRTPYASAAAANGQCLLFRRGAYHQCGGHAAVRGQIVEDVQLARRVKAAGLCLRMTDGAGLIQSRMYQNWQEVRNGYAKNILAGHGGSISLLLLSTLFHLTIFVGPWLWLLAATLHLLPTQWMLWSLGLVLLGVSVRASSAYATRQRIRDSWLLPLSTLLMSVIALQAIWWQLRQGGPQWKGRVYQ